MNKIFAILYTIISPTVMGIFVIAVLVSDKYSAKPIIIAIILGLIVAVPVTWFVERQVFASSRRKR